MNPDTSNAGAAPVASDITVSTSSPEREGLTPARSARPSLLLGYGVSLLLVAAAALAAFAVNQVVLGASLGLVFVVPVIVAALYFGWGPAFFAAVLGVGVLDFVFIEPRYTFDVASPSDIWTLGLLLVVAAIASTVGAQARNRAITARRSARQAQALQTLAHAVITSEPSVVLIKIAAETLAEIFDAPAVVLAENTGKLWPAASSGGAKPSAADMEAAHWALANDKPTRADAYPFDQSAFNFWPVRTLSGRRLVLGVKQAGDEDSRLESERRYVEMVAGYLASAA
jgi:two-component system sensor histidine kinase KdpD